MILATALAGSAFSQAAGPFLGRWDLTLSSPRGGTWPQWMEIVEKDAKLDGRIQPRGGAVRPIVAAKVDGGHLWITVSAATQRAPEVTWDLTTEGGKITGTQKQGENSETTIAGVRAPELKKPMPTAWTAAEPIFNGKDLTGWEPIGNVQNNKWKARDGELVNDNPAPPEGQPR
jgi:hypothetical protein